MVLMPCSPNQTGYHGNFQQGGISEGPSTGDICFEAPPQSVPAHEQNYIDLALSAGNVRTSGHCC
jgi:hypothetical protein